MSGSSQTLLSRNFVLAKDIDASGTANWNNGRGFIPIGDGQIFSGTLNGQSKGQIHTISGETNVAADPHAALDRRVLAQGRASGHDHARAQLLAFDL